MEPRSLGLGGCKITAAALAFDDSDLACATRTLALDFVPGLSADD